LSGRSRHGTSETIGDEGNRTRPFFASKTPISANPAKNGAQSGALYGNFDPDLGRIVAAWPRLSEAVKRSILTAVEDHQSHGANSAPE